MAWGQSGGLGVDTAAADAYGGNRGEVETAGGIEMGGAAAAAAAADLANALADALAGTDFFGGYDPGAVAVQDIAAQEAEVSGFDEDEAYEGQMMAAAAAPSQQVDEFGQMQRQAEADIAARDFSQWGGPYSTGFNTPVAGPTAEETQMGMAAPMGQATTAGTDFFGGSPTAPVDFANQTAGGTPGYAMPGVGTGVEDFTGMPGAVQAAPTSIEEVEMGMAAPIDSTSPNVGMITAGTSPYGDPLNRAAKPGAITAGGRTDQESGDLWAGAPAGTDFFGGEDVGTAAASPAGQRMTEEGINVHGKAQIDNAIMSLSEKFDYEAKVAKEKYGMRSQQYQKAQRLANTYKALDMYGKAYAATQGGSFIGNLIGGMPLVGALQSIQGWLTKQGIYSKIDTKQLEEDLRKASAAGNLRNFVRDLEGGPSDEDVQGPKEIRSFIQQYPWAAELDPKYIKYLIDNPAVLQDLLGQGPGGGDQAAPGNQTKPGGGGGGGSPPAGFTQKPGAATQALVEWSNPATGETWTAPNGSWQGPPGWVQV